MNEIAIRPEKAADQPGIRRVVEQAFDTHTEANLVDALRRSGRAAISLAACDGDAVVGHILFSPVTLAPPRYGMAGLGLAPLAVLPGRQRQGIGERLVQAGLQACRRLGADYVVVLGEPEYYHRFGFSTASASGLGNEYNVDEPFMVLELNPGCLTGVTATVRFAPEFAGV